jgi:thioredoxin 1
MSRLIDFGVEKWSEVVEEADKPVIVEFWHERCSACLEMKPIYEEIAEDIDDVKFTRVNILESKENRKYAIQLGVRSTPTFMIICDGTPIGSLVGIFSKEDLKEQIIKIVDNKESCLMASPLE